MPSNTFFRLPEEKRQRLLDAAWKEFTRVRYSQASINKIILAARIPRGSFYQYFTDKEDLFRYLVAGTQEHFIAVLNQLLTEHGGNLFAVPLAAFDHFSPQDNASNLELDRLVRLLQVNPGLDLHPFLLDRVQLLPDTIWETVDHSHLRRPDRESAEKVFCLLLACTVPAIILTLTKPEERTRQRQLLADRLDLIQFGAAPLSSSAPYTT